MTLISEKSFNCPCGYGNNLPVDTEVCPKCGLNLAPLSRIYMLSEKFSRLGDDHKKMNRPGVALSYYNAAQNASIGDDPNSLIQAIDIYIDQKNPKLAKDILDYGKELYPGEERWADVELRLGKLKEEIENNARQQYRIKSGLYITSGLFIFLLASFLFLTVKERHKDSSLKPLRDYVDYYQQQISGNPAFAALSVTSDSIVRFSGSLDPVAYQQFCNVLSSSDLSISKLNMNNVLVTSPTEQIFMLNYTVREGESLSKIAQSVYNDPSKWQLLFDANKDVIVHKNILTSGMRIKIPIEKKSANE